ncbi:MAG: hypothetical protein CVU38_10390 [Chloroflexi bacterium HGW-Chloroflexi-1]|nr:MAG: hypothetical protein CVU38_10390 [Chloroflexi bacterium HGW-Chloroflexi-1]
MLAAALLLILAGCSRGRMPTPTPTTAVSAPETRPAKTATGVIRAAEGGLVGLSDGAELTLPRAAVSDTAVITLRAVDDPPAAPIPRSIIGRAYEFTLEGGALTGIALLRLPLPAQVSPEQYDLGAYRWNGRSWERISGRQAGQSLQFGVDVPGLFAVQGQWRLAEATLTLTLAPTEPGQQTVPMTVAGQYRYAALPAMRHDYVQAHLLLKRDSSGGAGQVTGNEALDQTVAETVVWFKPDPTQAQGVIEFSHTFEIAPGELEIAPGSANRLYAALIVDDAAAPTRQLSTGVEYTQMLPIHAIGSDIVRPDLSPEIAQLLRWNAELNGQPLLQRPGSEPTLSLADVLAQGGLGEYHIRLEAQFEGKWVPVSNDVTVQLVLPVTATPTPTGTPQPGTATLTTPTPGTPGEPGASPTIPPTPTPRTPPGERTAAPTTAPSPTPGAAQPTASPTTTRPAWASIFWADRYTLAPGECTTLHWQVEDVQAVYLNDSPTTGREDRQICPAQTMVYKLRTVNSSGTQERTVTITVQSATQAAIEFTVDDYEITKGKCTTLHWRVINVVAVYLNDAGVAGEASQKICPETTTAYKLRVQDGNGTTVTRQLTVVVSDAAKIVMRFWAEQYTLKPGNCTTLHWSVEDVLAVYLQTTGQEEGVSGVGTRQVCPTGVNYEYKLRATASGDRSAIRVFTVDAVEPTLRSDEIIAQGLVNDVRFVNDLDATVGGDQPGWRILVDGINSLFTGATSCCQAVLTLQVPQSLTALGEGAPVDWPINPSQLIEFRAVCLGETCTLQTGTKFYLRLRSD